MHLEVEDLVIPMLYKYRMLSFISSIDSNNNVIIDAHLEKKRRQDKPKVACPLSCIVQHICCICITGTESIARKGIETPSQLASKNNNLEVPVPNWDLHHATPLPIGLVPN